MIEESHRICGHYGSRVAVKVGGCQELEEGGLEVRENRSPLQSRNPLKDRLREGPERLISGVKDRDETVCSPADSP